MQYIISEAQTQEELESCYKPTVVSSNFSVLPFNNLGDREFELLSYLLVKEEIKLKLHANFTHIVLMQGVGERGRDCVLYNTGKVCGLIQCKKYTGRLTKPALLKELIKFSLYANKDPSILPDIDNFQYFIFVTSDFTEPANTLLYDYKNSIANEIKNGNIHKFMEEVVNEYESFIKERHSLPIKEIQNILINLKITPVNGTELTARVNNIPTILQNFFKIQTVVSVTDADQLLRKALNDYGLKFLTDEDLKYIQERISSTAPEQRISFGFVDFYGYSADFFKNLKFEEYKKILDLVSELQKILYKKLLDFISNEIHRIIQTEVTHKLLRTGQIHTISVAICAPYLFKRISHKILMSSLPKDLVKKGHSDLVKAEGIENYISKDIYENLNSSEQDIKEQVDILIASSKKIMEGDYSELVGDEYLVNLKIDMFRHSHEGLKDIAHAQQQIQKDLLILTPTLQRMENELNQVISEKRTVLISDHAFMDNPTRLKNMLEACSKIGNLS
ncbi:hypothetical protein J7552_05545 [Wohlfahrtiimonas chitiniclastica]|uniref:hypothetical protein n=1 Tax=Wohlfahrtiimonas chitiniclastica TaxID=400946 RepID=UPI001BCD6356|nr:hypothetical protein [Wohlfahrtiimonas chitiniclastica]MBS7820746.1 hypothetical protein [Wohlfahrtiimonas chitiniclastica]